MRVNLPVTDPSIPINKIEMILDAALEAADPYILVNENLNLLDDGIYIGDNKYPVSKSSRIILLGLGKAAPQMIHAAMDILANRVHDCVCVCKHLPPDLKGLESVRIFKAGHPIPDNHSVKAARALMQAVKGLKQDDLVILMLSGGGSALASLPAPGVSLRDLQDITKILLNNGATINEMNIVRKHLDLFKGGGLLRMVSPARMAVLVLSDVVGSPLDIIASGPAVPDPSTYEDAFEILRRYTGKEKVAETITNHLKSRVEFERAQVETGKTSERCAYHKVIGSSDVSVDAAMAKAKELGFHADVVTYKLTGEARLAGDMLLNALEHFPLQKPCILFAGGETTVQVRGVGVGGRNLEVALGTVKKISSLKNSALVTLATDGEDGPTDAAGAIVTRETFTLAGADEKYLQYCLDENDSYGYFEKAGGLIKTGSTGTNVNDITCVISY
jgi:hydroxypyruvate reductase